MVLVADDLEVLELVVQDRGGAAADAQRRVRERVTGELAPDLLVMVVVDVAVPAGPYEVADLEIGLLGDHVRQQRVAGDVERHPEEQVGAALVELAGQLAVMDRSEEHTSELQSRGQL